MALKAGRHGVNRADIDTRTGRIKHQTLPIATKTKTGVVKIGNGISINGGGTISADPQLPEYTSSDSGKVLTIDENGDLEWQEKGAGGGDVYIEREKSIISVEVI